MSNASTSDPFRHNYTRFSDTAFSSNHKNGVSKSSILLGMTKKISLTMGAP
jgi:hypothetical protein